MIFEKLHMTPFFSVIIPTLNEEKYIPKILTDLVNQRETDFETIIIDGGSTDKTRDIVFSHRKLNPLFKIAKHKGPAYQRNIGGRCAKGEYLVFLDADASISMFFMQKMKSYIKKKGGFIFIPYAYPLEKNPQARMIFKIANFFINMSQTFGKPFSTGGSMVIDKNVFLRLNGFDEKLFMGEDHNIIQRAHKWGIKARFLPNIKLKFSLRRMRQEGQLKLFYKYLIATIHIYLRGDIKKQIFDYQMGGQLYKVHGNTQISLDQKVSAYFKQLLKTLQ